MKHALEKGDSSTTVRITRRRIHDRDGSEGRVRRTSSRWLPGPALSNNCSSHHPPANKRKSPTDVCLVHSHLPWSQARWAGPKLNLLMLHWTSIEAGSCQGELELPRHNYWLHICVIFYFQLEIYDFGFLSSSEVSRCFMCGSKISLWIEVRVSMFNVTLRGPIKCVPSDGYLHCDSNWLHCCLSCGSETLLWGAVLLSHLPATLPALIQFI